MKLADTRESYYAMSGKVSEIVRQLALAGIAVIWIFKKEVNGEVQVSRLLISAGILIVLGLIGDLLQYYVATRKWDKFNLQKERELETPPITSPPTSPPTSLPDEAYDPEEVDFVAPDNINDWPKTFFWLKVYLTAAGYVFIVVFLIRAIEVPG